jgi:hypothetical protein
MCACQQASFASFNATTLLPPAGETHFQCAMMLGLIKGRRQCCFGLLNTLLRTTKACSVVYSSSTAAAASLASAAAAVGSQH